MARMLSTPRGRITIAALMIVIGIAPMISVALAGLIATASDCPLHEGYVQPCLVFGRDIGGVLYTMVALGWLMLASVFLVGGGVLALAAEALRWLIRRALG